MAKAFLAIQNKIMKEFIKKSNIFEISEEPSEQHDILLCDTLGLGEKIKAKTKVYIASNIFENLDDINVYDDYDYFLGFGNKIYDYISNEFGLEPSKTFNGFVYVKDIEEKYNEEKPESLMSFSSCDDKKNKIKEFMYQKKLFDDMLFILSDKMINPKLVYRNLTININETSLVEEISNYTYNNSKINYFTTFMNCRMYFGQGNLVIPSVGSIVLLHNIQKMKNPSISQYRPHFSLIPLLKYNRKEKLDAKMISRFYQSCLKDKIEIHSVYQKESLYNKEILDLTSNKIIPDISEDFIESLNKIRSSL